MSTDPVWCHLHHPCVSDAGVPYHWGGTSFYFGGTSLLIVVVVVMDFMAQVQAH